MPLSGVAQPLPPMPPVQQPPQFEQSYNQQYPLPDNQQPAWNPPPPYQSPPMYGQPPSYNQPSPYQQSPQYNQPPYGQLSYGETANQNWQQSMYGGPGVMPEKNRSRMLVALLIAIAFVLIAGGMVYAFKDAIFSKPAMETPVITSFKASPSTISVGQVASLSWDISGATEVTIDQGIGTVSATGTRNITPTETTTYTLTATNEAGSETASSTITINKVGVPVVTSFEADPSTININQSAMLSWVVSGATEISISPGVGTTSPNGVTTISPNATTTYTLTATNEAGTTTATATVTLAGSGKPIIKTFATEKPTYKIGEAIILRWSVEGANIVLLDHGYGSVGTSGLITLSLEETDTYVLTASNSYGDTTASFEIKIE